MIFKNALRRLGPSVALIVGVAAGAIGGAGPAAADPPIGPDPASPWQDPAPCATAAVTGHETDRVDRSTPHLWLSGWAQRCLGDKGEPPTDPHRFGFAYFRPAAHGTQHPEPVAVMRSWRLFDYAPGAGPTAWRGRFDTWGTGEPRTAVPICLMRDERTRLACLYVELVEDKDGQTFAVTAIPTDDPRVTGHRVEWAVRPNGPTPTPECGSCV
jgi:hypothetical protein